jgi:uncharacterized protein YuzE
MTDPLYPAAEFSIMRFGTHLLRPARSTYHAILLIALLAMPAAPTRAQQAETNDATPDADLPVVRFTNGNVMHANLLRMDADGVVCRPQIAPDTAVPLRLESIRQIDLVAADERAAPLTVHLRDGSVLRGEWLDADSKHLRVNNRELGRMPVAWDDIVKLQRDAKRREDGFTGGSSRVVDRHGNIFIGDVDVLSTPQVRVRSELLEATVDLEAVSAIHFGRAPQERDQAEEDNARRYGLLLRRSGTNLVGRNLRLKDGVVRLDAEFGGQLRFALEDVSRIDFHPTGLADRGTLNGHTLLAYGYQNRVVELDADGKEVWSATVNGAWSAEKLPNGNVLVAGYGENMVIEFDADGERVWTYKDIQCLNARPAGGGHVLLADYSGNRALLVDRQNNVLWEYATPGSCADAHRLPNGNTMIAAGSTVQEVNADGQVLWEYGEAGNIYGIDVTPAGTILIADLAQNRVVEINRDKKIIWEFAENSPCDAYRLPNGNTLITSAQRFIEVDSEGNVVWEQKGCSYGSARK